MAATDRARFLRQMIDSEAEMDALFQTLAEDIGNLVFRAQNPDGTVPSERLAQIQKQAGRMVRAQFLDGSGQAFDENNEPLASFPRIIAEGQKAMVELALDRTVRILDKYLPEDIANQLRIREIKQP